MAVVYSKVLLFDPPLIYTAPDTCVFGAVNFALRIKMLKFALPPTRTLTFALPLTPTPNMSRWNAGCMRSPTRGAGIGHVDFMLFVSISFVLVSQRKLSFQWNMGLGYTLHALHCLFCLQHKMYYFRCIFLAFYGKV